VGSWTESDVVQQAFALNSPLIVSTGPARPAFIEAEGLPLSIGALKRAEDGNSLILRLYEPHGARGTAALRFGRPIEQVGLVNLLEDPVSESAAIALKSNGTSLDFRPFEVKSLRIVPA